jgi:hypothetical protein
MTAVAIQAYTFKADKVYEGLMALFRLNQLRADLGLPKGKVCFADTKPVGGSQLLLLIEYEDLAQWANEHDMVQGRMEMRRFLSDILAPMLETSNGLQVYKVVGEGFMDAVKSVQAAEAAGVDISKMTPPTIGDAPRSGPPPWVRTGQGPPKGTDET